jgi:hypothetical protein
LRFLPVDRVSEYYSNAGGASDRNISFNAASAVAAPSATRPGPMGQALPAARSGLPTCGFPAIAEARAPGSEFITDYQ